MKRSDHPPGQPTPTAPQPSTVVAEPATVEACADDYADRTGSTNPGQIAASPHTHGRR